MESSKARNPKESKEVTSPVANSADNELLETIVNGNSTVSIEKCRDSMTKLMEAAKEQINENYAKALSMTLVAFAQTPNLPPEAHMTLACAQEGMKMFNTALNNFKMLEALFEKKNRVFLQKMTLLHLSTCYSALNQFNEADEQLMKFIKLERGSCEYSASRQAKGRIMTYLQSQKLQGFDQPFRDNPKLLFEKNSRYYYEESISLHSAGQPEKALAALDKAIYTNPDNSEWYYCQGLALANHPEENQIDESIKKLTLACWLIESGLDAHPSIELSFVKKELENTQRKKMELNKTRYELGTTLSKSILEEASQRGHLPDHLNTDPEFRKKELRFFNPELPEEDLNRLSLKMIEVINLGLNSDYKIYLSTLAQIEEELITKKGKLEPEFLLWRARVHQGVFHEYELAMNDGLAAKQLFSPLISMPKYFHLYTDTSYRLGLCSYHLKNYTSALNLYMEAIFMDDPQYKYFHSDTHKIRAKSFFLRHFDNLAKLLTADPAIASIPILQKPHDQAAKVLEKSFEDSAEQFLTQKDADGAINFLTTAIERNPYNSNFFRLRALAFFMRRHEGDTTQILFNINLALWLILSEADRSSGPTTIDCFKLRGQFYLSTFNLPETKADLESALRFIRESELPSSIKNKQIAVTTNEFLHNAEMIANLPGLRPSAKIEIYKLMTKIDKSNASQRKLAQIHQEIEAKKREELVQRQEEAERQALAKTEEEKAKTAKLAAEAKAAAKAAKKLKMAEEEKEKERRAQRKQEELEKEIKAKEDKKKLIESKKQKKQEEKRKLAEERKENKEPAPLIAPEPEPLRGNLKGTVVASITLPEIAKKALELFIAAGDSQAAVFGDFVTFSLLKDPRLSGCTVNLVTSIPTDRAKSILASLFTNAASQNEPRLLVFNSENLLKDFYFNELRVSASGEVYDPTSKGRAYKSLKVAKGPVSIITPLLPDQMLEKNPLAMLRAIDHLNNLPGELSPSLEQAIKAKAPLLFSRADEPYVREQLYLISSLFYASKATENFAKMAELGILDILFPGLVEALKADAYFSDFLKQLSVAQERRLAWVFVNILLVAALARVKESRQPLERERLYQEVHDLNDKNALIDRHLKKYHAGFDKLVEAAIKLHPATRSLALPEEVELEAAESKVEAAAERRSHSLAVRELTPMMALPSIKQHHAGFYTPPWSAQPQNKPRKVHAPSPFGSQGKD